MFWYSSHMVLNIAINLLDLMSQGLDRNISLISLAKKMTRVDYECHENTPSLDPYMIIKFKSGDYKVTILVPTSQFE